MENKRRTLALVGLLLWTILLLFGCTKNVPAQQTEEPFAPPPPIAAVDTAEPVSQTWIVPGDRPRGTDAVWSEINAVLQDRWNTKVTVRHVPWNIWYGQSATLLAADSSPDALFVAGWGNYGKLVREKLLQPVDLAQLTRYAPDLASAITAWHDAGLRDCEVDGVSYMIPGAGNLQVRDQGVLLRGDMREQVGAGPIQTLDELDAFLMDLAEQDTGALVPWNAAPDSLLAYLQLAWFQPAAMIPVFPDFPFLACSLEESDPKVVNVLEEPSFVEALLRLRNLSVSGALSPQAIRSSLPADQLWLAGQSAVFVGSMDAVGLLHARTQLEHPEWHAEWALLNPDAKRVKEPMNTHGLGIPVGAPEMERTLLVLNELFANKALQDLSTAGLPGVHRMAGSVYVPAEKAKEYPFDGGGTWAWTNLKLMMPPAGEDWIHRRVSTYWLEKPDQLLSPRLAAFVFFHEPVARELSMLGSVLGNQAGTLLGGETDAVSDEVEVLRKAFSEAGLDTVRLEMQCQLDEFLKQP